METEAEETQQPSFISNRPVRILIFGVAVIIVCIVVVGIAITVLRTSRSSPISVDIYPGAQLINSGKNDQNDASLYSTQDSIDQVYDFYDKRLPKDDVQGCQKIFTASSQTDATQEATAAPPTSGDYFGRCVVDNSQLDVSQQLMITINSQLNDTTKKPETRFAIQRHWGG